MNFKWLAPKGVFLQIAATIIAATLVLNMAVSTLFWASGPPQRPDQPLLVASQLGAMLTIYAALDPSQRPRVLAAIQTSLPDAHVSLSSKPAEYQHPPDERVPIPLINALRDALPSSAVLSLAPHDRTPDGSEIPWNGMVCLLEHPPIRLNQPDRQAAAQPIDSGAISDRPDVTIRGTSALGADCVRFELQADHRPSAIFPIEFALGIIVLNTVAMIWWAYRALVVPLQSLARATDQFVADPTPRLIAENGPIEIRKTAAAFNRMQAHISQLLESRTRMLMAISHDLRTPITRLRLRAEFIEDQEQYHKTLTDLELMSHLLDSALLFFKTGRSQESFTLLDLPSMMQTICDNFSDQGYDVRYVGLAQLNMQAREVDLRRAIENLIENAVRYGTDVVTSVDRQGPDHVIIRVEDHGPGIPADQRENLMEPFARGDQARSMGDAQGFGLGLSIVSVIVCGHGGTFSLRENNPSGLIAEIVLPVSHPSLDPKI